MTLYTADSSLWGVSVCWGSGYNDKQQLSHVYVSVHAMSYWVNLVYWEVACVCVPDVLVPLFNVMQQSSNLEKNKHSNQEHEDNNMLAEATSLTAQVPSCMHEVFSFTHTKWKALQKRIFLYTASHWTLTLVQLARSPLPVPT